MADAGGGGGANGNVLRWRVSPLHVAADSVVSRVDVKHAGIVDVDAEWADDIDSIDGIATDPHPSNDADCELTVNIDGSGAWARHGGGDTAIAVGCAFISDTMNGSKWWALYCRADGVNGGGGGGCDTADW